MTLSFIKRPTVVLKQYMLSQGMLRPSGELDLTFQYGRLAMALEVITVLKTLEEIPITSDLGRAETESVLVTLLRDTGFDLDEVNELYDRLSAWRQPKFHRSPVTGQPSGGRDAELLDSVSVGALGLLKYSPRTGLTYESSSELVDRLGAEARRDMIRELPVERQSPHGDATDGSEESRDGGAESTPSG